MYFTKCLQCEPLTFNQVTLFLSWAKSQLSGLVWQQHWPRCSWTWQDKEWYKPSALSTSLPPQRNHSCPVSYSTTWWSHTLIHLSLNRPHSTSFTARHSTHLWYLCHRIFSPATIWSIPMRPGVWASCLWVLLAIMYTSCVSPAPITIRVGCTERSVAASLHCLSGKIFEYIVHPSSHLPSIQ